MDILRPAVEVPSNTLFVGNLPWSTKDEDLRAAFACTRPTVSQYGSRYAEWEAEFGSS